VVGLEGAANPYLLSYRGDFKRQIAVLLPAPLEPPQGFIVEPDREGEGHGRRHALAVNLDDFGRHARQLDFVSIVQAVAVAADRADRLEHIDDIDIEDVVRLARGDSRIWLAG